MKRADLIGHTFGLLIVETTVARDGRRHWLCRCSCGRTHVATTGNLKRGDVTHCGCQSFARRSAPQLIHGHNRGNRRSKEYRTWAHIVGRCHNPNDRAFADYGGRGICVCDRWLESFENFLSDIGQAPSPTHSIERVNNDGNYEPNNCRWATRMEQARNTRRTVLIDGMCLKDVCELRHLSYGAVQARLRRGHPVRTALSSLTGAAYRKFLRAEKRS